MQLEPHATAPVPAHHPRQRLPCSKVLGRPSASAPAITSTDASTVASSFQAPWQSKPTKSQSSPTSTAATHVAFFFPLPPSHLHQCPPGSGGNTTGYTRFEQSEEQEALTCISLVLVLSSSFSNCPSLAAAVAYLCGEETSTTDKLPKQKRSIPTSAVARGPDLVPRRRLRLAQPALRLLGVAGMRGFHMPHPIYRTRTPLEASGRLC